MKKLAMLFTLCVLSTPSLFTMQLMSHKKSLAKTAVHKSRACSMLSNSNSEMKTKLNKKIDRLTLGNGAMCGASIAAACATNNPYFLLPLVPHIASIAGIGMIDLATNHTSNQPDLIRDLTFFVEQRKRTLQNFVNEIRYKDKQILWLKNEIANEKLLANIGAKTELLEEYIITLADREKLKDSYSNKFEELIAPIFNQHQQVNLQECLLYNEKKLAILNKTWIFQIPSLPLACIPKFIHTTKNRFDDYGEAWQLLIGFDACIAGGLTLAAGCEFPIHVASILAHMTMAYQNQMFFEEQSLNTTKEHLKLITDLIKFQQNRLTNKS